MKKISIHTNLQQVTLEELPTDYQKLIELAKTQTKSAYAPYSKFFVGAAVLLNDGQVIGGNNQENAAYPSGLCAERVALFYANSQHPSTPIKALAIAAYTNNSFVKKPIAPCGSCLQVLVECELRFNQNIEIILYGEQEIYHIKKAGELLPFSFTLK